MDEKLPDFEAILRALTGHGVRFVLVGGLAMTAHGTANITEDIDISYARDRENAARLVKSLDEFQPRLRNFPPDLPFVWDEATIRGASNLTLVTQAASVDLLGDIQNAPSFEELWSRSVQKEMYGCVVRVAAVDDLIRMKEVANRLKDRDHILQLQALKKLLYEGAEHA